MAIMLYMRRLYLLTDIQLKPLRNFGCRQSDAIEYRDNDLKDVTEAQLNMLIRIYNPKVKYKRCVDENGVAWYRKMNNLID